MERKNSWFMLQPFESNRTETKLLHKVINTYNTLHKEGLTSKYYNIYCMSRVDFGHPAVNSRLHSSLSCDAKSSLHISPSISGHKTSPVSKVLFFLWWPCHDFCSVDSQRADRGAPALSVLFFYGDPKANVLCFSTFLRAIKTNWCADAASCFAISRGRSDEDGRPCSLEGFGSDESERGQRAALIVFLLYFY